LPELPFEILLFIVQTGSLLLASHANALDLATSLPHFDHANTCIFWTIFPLSNFGTLLVVLCIAVEAAYAINIVVLSVVPVVGVAVICIIAFVEASAVAIYETVATLNMR